MSKSYIYLLIVNFLISKFVSLKLGQIVLVLMFIKYFIDMGVFSRTKFIKGIFHKSDIFYWEYIGEYKKLSDKFKKLGEINSKYCFNKNLWNTIGFYYDDPKTTPPHKCRAIVGFQYIYPNENSEEKSFFKNDLMEFMKNEGFKHKKINTTKCIIANYTHINFLSIIFAIKKFYTNLEKKCNDPKFLNYFGIEKKEPKFTCTFEIYKEKNLEFGIPLENDDQFIFK